jgi:secondary thiamine-phosphate synthase enzyme
MQAPVVQRGACFHSFVIARQTKSARQFIDITDEVQSRIREAGIENGLAIVASQHTTASIVINEHEPELLKDLDLFLGELAPTEGTYAHNAVPCGPGEQPNGHAHCQALLLSASASVPVADGRAILGRWQRIFLVELDCARPRRVTLVVLGT